MKVELYNNTDRVKEVPKFNYEGKVRINPEGVYPIQDYMIPFYRPYARIGIIIRACAIQDEIEKEVASQLSAEKSEPEKVEVKKVQEVEEKKEKEEEESVPIQEENSEESKEVTVEEKPQRKIYTELELQDYRVAELKEISENIGIILEGDIKKKAPYIEAILAKQAQQ